MMIKKHVVLFGMLGCLAIGCIGCGNTVSCYTTAAEPETTAEVLNENKETEDEGTDAVEETEVGVAEAMKETEQERGAEETFGVAETAAEYEVAAEATNLDSVVAKAILAQNSNWYTGEECRAEGHLILEDSEEEGVLTVYALTMYGEYAFQNVDYFIKSSGTGVIPAVLTFQVDEEEKKEFVSVEWPEDGSGYTESIKRMFPEHLWDRVLSIQETDREALTAMERGYAKRYLEAMGRDAVIGEYSDVGHTQLTDYGISVEVSNKMLEYEKGMGPYPSWHGTTEKIENGVRYIYSVFVDEEVNQIIYEKCVFDTLETVEKFVYDAETGEEIEHVGS